MTSWQEQTLQELVSFFENKKAVLAVLVFGSLSSLEEPHDKWSDIDLVLVVEPESQQRYFPGTEWLETFGRVYACDQAENEYRKITRVCFDDMRRIDFVITTEDKLAQVDIWPRSPMQVGARVLFSRSRVVDEAAEQFHREPEAPKFQEARFQTLVQKFRFKSMLAVYKVARDDLLIAAHLALDLLRDCAFLAMVIRDRAVGMDYHKTGGIGNKYVRELEGAQRAFTAIGILEMIGEANRDFERLAFEWDPGFRSDLEPMLGWIEEARGEILDRD